MSKYLVCPYKLFSDVCHTQYYEEKLAKIFCHRENSYYFEMFLSCDLLESKGLILSIPPKMSKNIVNPYQLFLGLWNSMIAEKRCHNLFFTGRVVFFSSKHCFSNNLLGVTEMILLLAPELPKYLVCPYNFFPAFVILNKTRGKRPKFFFNEKFAFVFKNLFFFNNFLGPEEMILSVAQ